MCSRRKLLSSLCDHVPRAMITQAPRFLKATNKIQVTGEVSGFFFLEILGPCDTRPCTCKKLNLHECRRLKNKPPGRQARGLIMRRNKEIIHVVYKRKIKSTVYLT